MYLKQYVSLIEKYVSASITDINGVITHVSEAFCYITGFTREELVGNTHAILRHPDTSDDIYKDLWETITQGSTWHGKMKNKTKDGNSYWVESFIEPVFNDGNIIGYQAVRLNITEQKLLENIAESDNLTGLLNRYKTDLLLREYWSEAFSYQHPFSIIMVDLDDFKQVNDLYGHPVGDIVLQKTAEIFLKIVRQTDKIGRWGGEEFLILLPKTTYQQAFLLAKRLRKGLYDYEYKNIGHRTASFGVAYMDEDDTRESLIAKADKALYDSKKLGKNRVS